MEQKNQEDGKSTKVIDHPIAFQSLSPSGKPTRFEPQDPSLLLSMSSALGGSWVPSKLRGSHEADPPTGISQELSVAALDICLHAYLWSVHPDMAHRCPLHQKPPASSRTAGPLSAMALYTPSHGLVFESLNGRFWKDTVEQRPPRSCLRFPR